MAVIEAIERGDPRFADSHLDRFALAFVNEANRSIRILRKVLDISRPATKLLSIGTMTNPEGLSTVSELFLMRFFDSRGELADTEVPLGNGKDADLKVVKETKEYLIDLTCALDPSQGGEQIPRDGTPVFFNPRLHEQRKTLENRVCRKWNDKFEDVWKKGASGNFTVAVDIQRFTMIAFPLISGIDKRVAFDSAYVFQQCQGLRAVLIYSTYPQPDRSGLGFIDHPDWYERP
ncbi:MAG: hypothetical protein KIT79_09670 [Deltaproteobacteria bacterium]|nr:hypothetical protein [Deltaproteobacteria bacterium]